MDLKDLPKDAILIDVRTREEYNLERVKGALNIDILSSTFMGEIQKLEKKNNYLLYCRSGNRSGQAEAIMRQIGFESVKNIGGLEEVRELFGTEF